MIGSLALTISPPHRPGKKQELLYYDDYFFIQQLELCSDHFMVYPEFDSNGRLHYHGVIDVKDQIKWFKKVLPTLQRKVGFTCVKKLGSHKDKIGWIVYMSKDWYTSKGVLSLEKPIMPCKLQKRREAKLEKALKNCIKDLDQGIDFFFPVQNKPSVTLETPNKQRLRKVSNFSKR